MKNVLWLLLLSIFLQSSECMVTFKIWNYNGKMATRVADTSFYINIDGDFDCESGIVDYPIHVDLDLVGSLNNELEDLKQITITEDKIYSKKIKISRAYRDVKIRASFENNISYSDNFSIRPKSLTIDTNGTSNYYTSGEDYRFILNSTSGYETNTLTVSVVDPLTNTEDEFNSKLVGNYLDFNYTDIGSLELNITDLQWSSIDSNECSKDYENIDCSGINELCSCYIRVLKENVAFKPSALIIEDFNLSSFPNSKFVPLSNSDDYQGVISANIRAINSFGETTQNYSSGLYANDITIEINGTKLLEKKIHYFDDDNNSKKIYLANNFIDGNMILSRKFNFYRETNVTQEPFSLIDSNDINLSVSDLNYSLEASAQNFNGSLDFKYMRINPIDVSTSEDAIVKIFYEVYSSKNIGDESIDSLNWYIQRPTNNSDLNLSMFTRSDNGSGADSLDDNKTYDEVTFYHLGVGERVRVEIDLSQKEFLFYNPYSQSLKDRFYIEFLDNIDNTNSNDITTNKNLDVTKGKNRLGE